eukprot:m.1585904 g.1585904  ORF g.1585904 m.1585904 type:complete len:51 (-) comp25326_c0_seq3:322-474(-)
MRADSTEEGTYSTQCFKDHDNGHKGDENMAANAVTSSQKLWECGSEWIHS